MSYDRQIDQLCPHQVVEEALYVNPDQITIRPQRPVASASSVHFRMNGVMDVPSFGVRTPGQVVGKRLGPYNITAGVNDKIVCKVGVGAIQTLVLTNAQHVTPAHLCDLLNRQAVGIVFFAVGNQVQIRTGDEGRGAAFFLYGASTLATYLGIATNHEYRGKQITPGWTLITDPLTLADRPTRLVRFDTPLKSIGDFVELSYSTVRQECRRCGGTGVENDWRYSKTGEVAQVRDEALLIQEIQKLFYTVRGTNPFHTWYGTTLLEMIGKKISAGNVMQNLIVSDIYSAFNRWQSIKNQQEQKVGQFVSDEEYPFRLLGVDLQQSTKDPTVIFINITIQNRSQRPIQLSRGLKIPEPTDLLGSTQQQGLIRQSLSQFVQSG
jgi:phage baseplate assembly protein W